jgi:glycosyltransferase involved in cell wall biosynthesis
MRILMVSPYPPFRDGIAAYALQAVSALRGQGHEVEVLSPGPSAAHHHLDLQGPRGPLALARRVRGYDKVVIQFHPDMFYPAPSTPLRHAAVSAALLVAVRAMRHSEVVVHEIDYRIGRRRGVDGFAARRLWRRVDSILLHTQGERRDFIEAFGARPERLVVTAHGAHFVRRTSMARKKARDSLGIPQDELVFLAIGFIQPHKGFDRAVMAFGSGLAEHGCSLHIVGSVRVDEPEYLAYLSGLEALVEATPGAHLHNQYVSDELFDRWLVASDVVVLPYRNIWSSGVLERALLYERRVIATAVGGLRNQVDAREGITLIDPADLEAAMWRAKNQNGRVPSASVSAWPEGGEQLRVRVQDMVVARATTSRGMPVRPGRVPAASNGHSGLPLHRLPPLGVPAPTSARPGASLLKRLVRRATAWQIDPLIAQLNALREGTIQSLERVAQAERDRVVEGDRLVDPAPVDLELLDDGGSPAGTVLAAELEAADRDHRVG